MSLLLKSIYDIIHDTVSYLFAGWMGLDYYENWLQNFS